MGMLTLAVLYLLRSYGSATENPDFTERVFAAQERHPGLIEEIWFGGCGDEFGRPGEMGREAARQNLGVKERCGKLGIAFSYQQGVTLNHGPDDVRREGFPEDAWAVDREGKVRYGLFCCTSPFVMNMGTGETPPLELAIRRGVGGRWRLIRPKERAVTAGEAVGDGTLVRIPPLPPFGVAAVVIDSRSQK